MECPPVIPDEGVHLLPGSLPGCGFEDDLNLQSTASHHRRHPMGSWTGQSRERSLDGESHACSGVLTARVYLPACCRVKCSATRKVFPSGSTKQVPIAIPLIGRRRRGYQTIIEHDGRTFGKIAIPDASVGKGLVSGEAFASGSSVQSMRIFPSAPRKPSIAIR